MASSQELKDEAEMRREILSGEVDKLKRQLGLRQMDISTECGINASMLSQWMQGRYKGNIRRLNRMMEYWMEQRRAGKEVVPMSRAEAVREVAQDASHLYQTPGTKAQTSNKRQREDPQSALQASGALAETFDYPTMQARRKLYQYPKKVPLKCCLVPIRLQLELEGKKLDDFFSWNLYEREYTVESFTKELMQDLDLSPNFEKMIQHEIRAQIELQQALYPWNQWAAPEHHHQASPATPLESLHPIKIHIRCRDQIYMDQVEWDLENPANDPETFARTCCRDQGLGGEMEAAIAYTVREQLSVYAALISAGYGHRVSRMSPVSLALTRTDQLSRHQVVAWEGPTVKYLMAQDIPLSTKLTQDRIEKMGILWTKPPTPPQPTITTTTTGGVAKSSMKPPVPSPAAAAAVAGPVTKPNPMDKPPKHVNTFLMFCKTWRKDFMVKHPTENANNISKLLGEMWQKLTAEQRYKYQPLADAENARRYKEWEELRRAKGLSVPKPKKSPKASPS